MHGAADWIDRYPTLTEALLSHVDGRRSGPTGALRFVSGLRAAARTEVLTLPELVTRSLRLSGALRRRGLAAGQMVFIALPTGPGFVLAYCAVVLAGGLPCAVPEEGAAGGHPLSNHVRAALARFAPVLLLGTPALRLRLVAQGDAWAAKCVAPEELEAEADDTPVPVHRPAADDLLHVQLTSGSTAQPKAAALSHRAVIANMVLTAACGSCDVNEQRGMSWLPLFHDMGLVSLLSALYHGCELLLQPPDEFILDPMSWLGHISAHRCTATAAPNFALAYCVRRYRADLLAGVDLSCLRNLVVGAEKVQLSTLRRFAAAFAPHGLRSDALFPCYGTAEMTLAVTVPRQRASMGLGGRVRWDEQPVLGPDGQPLPTPGEQGRQDWLVGLGQPLDGCAIQIRDPQGRVLGPRELGEVHVGGPCLMQGYHRDPEATAAVLRDGWYASGDFGYLDATGELYLGGRIKELIILRGRNYPPHEFEECAVATGRVDEGRVAAFGVADPVDGSEKLVLAIEPERYEQLAELRLQVQERLRQRFGFGAGDICFVKKGAIPRTTSRKIRRLECVALYARQALPLHHEQPASLERI